MITPVRDYVEGLNCSFTACYRLLEQPRAARRAVVALLAIHTALLAYSAYVHSPTLNEPGHLVAGLSHWKFGRFELYRNNPPLVRMVAALPVMVVGYQEDWSSFYDGPGAMPQFAIGEDFVAANGERSFFLFMIARWACLPFSWLGAVVCYLWARDLFGRPAGVAACAIWCFEPNILAHASLITPDAHATALGLAACYTFWRWLKKPTWRQAALTGVVLGLAELAKTTLILFYPLWPVMWVAYRLMERRAAKREAILGEDGPQGPSLAEKRFGASMWLREGGMLALRMAIGLYVLNMGYGFDGALTPLGEFHFVSDMLTGNESGGRDQGAGARSQSNPESDARASQLAPRASSTNRFAGTWLASIPSPFPKLYLLGIDLQQRDFEHWSSPSYLRGEWRDDGWWYYYLYACAIKVPLGLWALGVFTLMASAAGRGGAGVRGAEFRGEPSGARSHGAGIKGQTSGVRAQSSSLLAAHGPPPASARDIFILLLPPLVIFVVVSAKTEINEHMRYVLPSLPFVFIGLSGIVRNFVDKVEQSHVNCRSLAGITLRRAACPLLFTLLLWPIASSWWIYPHSLSYFNEAIGGPLNGPQHLLGSNVDWGQDLRYVIPFCKSRRSPLIAWRAYCEPEDLLGRLIDPNRALRTAESPRIVGVNFIEGDRQNMRGNFGSEFKSLEDFLKGLDHAAEVSTIGYSMRVFESPSRHIR